jgi:SAM-dependent methyltransferase
MARVGRATSTPRKVRSRRWTFDSAADMYDRARPRYPDALVRRLVRAARLGPGVRVLEIGCGPGVFTRQLAPTGAEVVAVELGPRLAARARRNLRPYPNVRVIRADFETWPLPAPTFDLVVAAGSFHWLDPKVRARKCAQALRPGGLLGLVGGAHVAGGTRRFWVESQRCYLRWVPGARAGFRFPRASSVRFPVPDLDRSEKFGPCVVHRFTLTRTYTTQEYRDLLLTYSDVLALPTRRREGLLDCLTGLIRSRYGGEIVKRELVTLQLWRRGKDP